MARLSEKDKKSIIELVKNENCEYYGDDSDSTFHIFVGKTVAVPRSTNEYVLYSWCCNCFIGVLTQKQLVEFIRISKKWGEDE